MRLSAVQVKASKHETEHILGARAGVRRLNAFVKMQRGFTLVELITVIVILGVISVAAAPRFFDRNTFDSQGFHDQVISTLRYAQKEAIAQRRFICVAIASNAVTLTYDATPPSAAHTAASCPGTPMINPATGVAPYTVSSSVGVAVSAATFNFDALGRASAPQSITVGGNAPITVEAETGYVH